jgi:hypothetical protein
MAVHEEEQHPKEDTKVRRVPGWRDALGNVPTIVAVRGLARLMASGRRHLRRSGPPRLIYRPKLTSGDGVLLVRPRI